MWLLERIVTVFFSRHCGARERIIRSDAYFTAKCHRSPGHEGNHYDYTMNQDFGPNPLRPARLGPPPR